MTKENKATIRRQSVSYMFLLAGHSARESKLTPVEARRAIVAMSGLSHTRLAGIVEQETGKPATRQLVSMIIDGLGRSDRVERALAKIYRIPHSIMFPEERSRRPVRKKRSVREAAARAAEVMSASSDERP